MAAAAFQTQLPHVALPSGHSPAISKAQRRSKRSSRSSRSSNVCMLEKAFENWLAHGGARVSRIESASFPGGLRGIKATDTIRAGTSSQHLHRSLFPPPCIADTKHCNPSAPNTVSHCSDTRSAWSPVLLQRMTTLRVSR